MVESINVNLLKTPAMSLSGPVIYIIPGPYSPNSRHQRSTIFVVKFSKVRFLWSGYTVIQRTKIMVWNYSKVSTLINSYRYVLVLFICEGVNLHD